MSYVANRDISPTQLWGGSRAIEQAPVAQIANGSKKNIKKLVSWIGLGWASWSLAGGLYFILAAKSFRESDNFIRGYTTVGVSLIICGVISFIGMANARLNRISALLCAVACFSAAVILQLATPQFDQSDIDAWLLLICAFSSMTRWALLKLEPYIAE